jgi:hypothetical protein
LEKNIQANQQQMKEFEEEIAILNIQQKEAIKQFKPDALWTHLVQVFFLHLCEKNNNFSLNQNFKGRKTRKPTGKWLESDKNQSQNHRIL